MNDSPKRDSVKESVVFSGRIGEVVDITQPDGQVFERFRRPPGTRLIIVSSESKILVTREYRHETGQVDLRLPGGKVCDTLSEYRELLKSGSDIAEVARRGAIKEALEETGLVVADLEFLVKANAGATVEWDLYYFMIRNYSASKGGQQLEQGEDITVTWMSPQEIRRAITAVQMNEWRSVGVLLGRVLPLLEK